MWICRLVGYELYSQVLGCATLIMRHRGVSRREVKLDIQAIKQQANQVKSDDFLQSIQAQLKRHSEQQSAEKVDGESRK